MTSELLPGSMSKRLPMQSFVNFFPEIAEKETRVMHVFRRSKETPLPPDEYVFAEYYCDEKGCDCRRVMICVQAMKARRIMATISLGFDSMDPDAGPFLDDLNSQSSHSNLFLNYLKKLVSHFIYVGQQENAVPPPGLLKAAENLAGEYWYPVAVDFEKEISLLEAQLPAEFGNKAKVREVLENSRQWPEMPFGHSWFEDDAEVDKCVRTFAGRSGEKPGGIRQAQKMILKFIIEGKRRDWGERMLWMALRSLLCLDRNPLPWAPFMIVSRELLSGTPLRDIPLMESVAERSAWSGLRRLGEFPQ